jgi:glycerophosphoryl diester phosphodiesterase
MGVDMVEIDIHETKDGKLVLMHDGSIDRTTNGKGLVRDWTLDSLKTLRLLDQKGSVTTHKIPTLEEALLVAKGKILLNLDKSYNIFDKCYEIMKRTNTLNQVIIKGAKTRAVVEREFGDYLDKVYFMPIVSLSSKSAKTTIDDYLENRLPVAFEMIIPQDSLELVDYFSEIKSKGSSIWVNSLWSSLCAGHTDEKAAKNPAVYDWYIEHGVDIIQTDNPQLLIEYLREKGLHR